MAEQSYPFENQSTSETQYSNLFRLLADTGVAGSSTSADLRPYGDSTGMFVKVPTGTALVRGFLYLNDSLLTLPVTAAAGTQRVDSVVLRLDPAANTITATVKAGTPGGGAPALTQTDAGVYEARLADVTVPAGTTTISAGQVADRRPYTSLPWGEWSNDSRPTSPTRGKAGYNQTTGAPEYWDGGAWRSFSTTTTDAGQLTTGFLPNARLDYGVVAAARGDRTMDAPLAGGDPGVINGDWNQALQPGVYRIFAGYTNQNAPSNAQSDLYGTLLVIAGSAGMGSRTQVYYSNTGASWTRTAWNGTDFSVWRYTVNDADLGNIRNEYNPRLSSLEGRAGNLEGRSGALESSRPVNRANVTQVAAGMAVANNFTSTGYGGTSAFSGYVDVTWPSMALTSVVATAQSGDTGGCSAQVTNLSNTGCRIVVVRRNNTSTGVNWIATGN